jgi:hypothetical protein
LYRGTWADEQVGVKAPGSENTTTVFPPKTSSLATSRHSWFSRTRNRALGILSPSRFFNISIQLLISIKKLLETEPYIRRR